MGNTCTIRLRSRGRMLAVPGILLLIWCVWASATPGADLSSSSGTAGSSAAGRRKPATSSATTGKPAASSSQKPAKSPSQAQATAGKRPSTGPAGKDFSDYHYWLIKRLCMTQGCQNVKTSKTYYYADAHYIYFTAMNEVWTCSFCKRPESTTGDSPLQLPGPPPADGGRKIIAQPPAGKPAAASKPGQPGVKTTVRTPAVPKPASSDSRPSPRKPATRETEIIILLTPTPLPSPPPEKPRHAK